MCSDGEQKHNTVLDTIREIGNFRIGLQCGTLGFFYLEEASPAISRPLNM